MTSVILTIILLLFLSVLKPTILISEIALIH